MTVRCRCLLALLAFAAALPLCLSRSLAAEYDGSPPFQRAQKIRLVVIKRTRTIPAAVTDVRCFYFPQIMIKEIDEGDMGDAQISYVARARGKADPACRRAALPGEHVLPLKDDTAYFEGFAAGTIFLLEADASNGTLPFFAYDVRTNRRRFEDARKLGTKFTSIAADGERLRLHYIRAVTGSCSVVAYGDGCWTALARQTNLPPSPPPACRAGYELTGRAFAEEVCRLHHDRSATCVGDELRRRDWDHAESVIGFDVDVAVPPAGEAVITPVKGPIACWPSD
jgi:hypothetical protein